MKLERSLYKFYCFWRIYWYVYGKMKSAQEEQRPQKDGSSWQLRGPHHQVPRQVLEVPAWRCGTRKSCLPAHLTATIWTILCWVSLSYRSRQSLTTKPKTWSWRSRRWWGPSTGTPRWRHSSGTRQGSRLLSPLTAISLNELMLIMFFC